jgi:predicted lipid-binding transport protein (Tim44 family)
MRTLIATFAVCALLAGLAPDCAEAARMGGGRSFGAQRQITPPARKVARQQAAPAQTAPAAKPSAVPGGNRWLGPLAGLAAGIGLGWLFSQGGFGAGFSAIVLALLVGIAVVALARLLLRRRDGLPSSPYAALGRNAVSAPAPSQFAVLPGAAPLEPERQAARVPVDFDEAGFVKQAKLNFIRLQNANDSGDMETLREVTTEEMFAALSADFAARGKQAQQTDVANLSASVLEVATEDDMHWVSVHFSGMLREDANAEPAAFDEVWHLQKPVAGQSGWLLAGIQQVT